MKYSQSNCCSNNIERPKLKTVEVLILLIVASFAPAYIVSIFYVKDESANLFNITSIYYVIFLTFSFIISITTKRPYLSYFFGCHGRENRSFNIINNNLYLCARCTGIMIGMIISVVITKFKFNYNYLLFLLIPLITDGIIQKKTNYRSNNYRRLITGILFGIGFIILLSNIYILNTKIIIKVLNLIQNIL